MGNWWAKPEHGTIFDSKGKGYNVTFNVGSGERKGQTVIADGFLSESEFHNSANHNHYEPNTDCPGGGRIEDRGGDRGKYTGPGH